MLGIINTPCPEWDENAVEITLSMLSKMKPVALKGGRQKIAFTYPGKQFATQFRRLIEYAMRDSARDGEVHPKRYNLKTKDDR